MGLPGFNRASAIFLCRLRQICYRAPSQGVKEGGVHVRPKRDQPRTFIGRQQLCNHGCRTGHKTHILCDDRLFDPNRCSGVSMAVCVGGVGGRLDRSGSHDGCCEAGLLRSPGERHPLHLRCTPAWAHLPRPRTSVPCSYRSDVLFCRECLGMPIRHSSRRRTASSPCSIIQVRDWRLTFSHAGRTLPGIRTRLPHTEHAWQTRTRTLPHRRCS